MILRERNTADSAPEIPQTVGRHQPHRRSAVESGGLDRVFNPKQSQREAPTGQSGLLLHQQVKGEIWLRGPATTTSAHFKSSSEFQPERSPPNPHPTATN